MVDEQELACLYGKPNKSMPLWRQSQTTAMNGETFYIQADSRASIFVIL